MSEWTFINKEIGAIKVVKDESLGDKVIIVGEKFYDKSLFIDERLKHIRTVKNIKP